MSHNLDLSFSQSEEADKTLSLIHSAIEATCHAPSWEGVYGEIFKVLKPGGTVSILFLSYYPTHKLT